MLLQILQILRVEALQGVALDGALENRVLQSLCLLTAGS